MNVLKTAAVIIITAYGLYSCSGGSDKNTEEISKDSTKTTTTTTKEADLMLDCTGLTNLLLPNDSAFAMMSRYDSIYRKSKTANPLTYLSNSIWIDGMLINSYANFFESNAGKSFDGVRFVHAATNKTTNSRLLMVPTRPVAGNPRVREDVWGKNLIPLETGDPVEYLDYETSQNVAAIIKENFYKFYRNGRGLGRDKDPLSESVWMSKCVFIYLRDAIKRPENQIDGIRVYMGAYGKMMGTVPGQINPNQSTVLLVPTTEGTTKKEHNDRWDLLKPAGKLRVYDVLNHGELCPRQCDSNPPGK